MFDRGNIGDRGDGADAGDGHKELRACALPCRGKQVLTQTGGTFAQLEPDLRQRQDDLRQPAVVCHQLSDVEIKHASGALRDDEPEGFMKPPIWLVSWVVMSRS